jgi:dGTPase
MTLNYWNCERLASAKVRRDVAPPRGPGYPAAQVFDRGLVMNWYARRESWKKQTEDARDETDIDYARIVHSASFRRLQGKTQILNLGDSDFYRTRLTHSLEVAQIAGGLARQFAQDYPDHPARRHLPELSLIQTIGFCHDLGHPPFGHGGEVALNYCMREHGGFEGNGQTLRVLARLEKFSDAAGANLTRRAMLGILKYPVPYSLVFNPKQAPRLDPRPTAISIIDRAASKPPKCYLDSEADIVDWILQPLSDADRARFCAIDRQQDRHHKSRHKSFDCSIMDLADDIGFGVHDLEDALALDLISEQQFRQVVSQACCASFLTTLKSRDPAEPDASAYDRMVDTLFGDGHARKRMIGRMVRHLLTACRIEAREGFDEPLIAYRAVMADGPATFLKALQGAVRDLVILSPAVQHLEFKGQKMVVSVFEAFASEPRAFLPRDTYRLYERADQPVRVICDHIAGMTDGFLLKTYDRLFSPRMGSVFDRL